MAHFEKISKYADVELNVPVRGTERSAGYDFEVAEDTVVPSYLDMMAYIDKMVNEAPEDKRPQPGQVFPLEEINKIVDSINEDILTRGGTDLEEYIDHDLVSYFYGNHVLSALQDAFDEGKVVENDTRAWY